MGLGNISYLLSHLLRLHMQLRSHYKAEDSLSTDHDSHVPALCSCAIHSTLLLLLQLSQLPDPRKLDSSDRKELPRVENTQHRIDKLPLLLDIVGLNPNLRIMIRILLRRTAELYCLAFLKKYSFL